MENQENNNLSELDQLKAQYEALKEQFDQQEIVNDRLFKSAIQNNLDFFARNRKTVMIVYPIMAVLQYIFFETMGFRVFGLILALLLAVCTMVELWLTRNTRQQVVENSDLLTLSKNMQQLKTGYAIYIVLWLFACFLFFAAFLFKCIDRQDLSGEGLMRTIWVLGFMGVLLVIFAIVAYRIFVGHCSNIIRQIDAIEGRPTTKKNRTFWYFLAAMTLLIVGGLVLAYQWGKPACYSRAGNDLTTEGKLAIWEVYADTLVAEEDVAAVTECWQTGDSLVVMMGKRQSMEVGMDDIAMHSWKHDNDDAVETVHAPSLLYALKKATPEGPAISSNVLGGKPMVAKMVCTHPRKYPNTEPVPMIVHLTPEAAQLWHQFTTEVTGHRAALVMDNVVIQDWKVMCGIENGTFFIMDTWSSKEEMRAFCDRMIKQ